MKYKVAFRIFPSLLGENFPDYEKYYDNPRVSTYNSTIPYIGETPSNDEDIYSNSNKIQK